MEPVVTHIAYHVILLDYACHASPVIPVIYVRLGVMETVLLRMGVVIVMMVLQGDFVKLSVHLFLIA